MRAGAGTGEASRFLLLAVDCCCSSFCGSEEGGGSPSNKLSAIYTNCNQISSASIKKFAQLINAFLAKSLESRKKVSVCVLYFVNFSGQCLNLQSVRDIQHLLYAYKILVCN